MPSPKQKIAPTDGMGYRLSGFLIIVVFASLGLVWLWLQLPKKSEQPRERPVAVQPEVQQPVVNPLKASCEAARGKWVDCGNPCHGKPGEACSTICEPQCLCGGIAGFGCPADRVCTDLEPAPQAPDAMGVCRVKLEAVADASSGTKPVREAPAGMVCDAQNFICVDPAFAENELTSPFVATGTGIAFENTINWRLLNGSGGELEKGTVMADAPDVGQPGQFDIRAFLLQVPTTEKGTLEVFEYSAKDGTPIHKVSIPVKLPTEVMEVRVFKSAMDGKDCSAVFPVSISIPRSGLPVETSLRQLLTDAPVITPGTRLISLSVKNGTATAVFSSELEGYGGGSCAAQTVRSEIESTLKQFPSIKNVVISVQGKTPEESLQP